MQVETCKTPDGIDIFQDWLENLRDIKGAAAITGRIAKIQNRGYFGDHKYLREGIWELRINSGPGYRVYYCHFKNTIIILLCAGDKSGQKNDIKKAIALKKDHQLQKLKEQN